MYHEMKYIQSIGRPAVPHPAALHLTALPPAAARGPPLRVGVPARCCVVYDAEVGLHLEGKGARYPVALAARLRVVRSALRYVIRVVRDPAGRVVRRLYAPALAGAARGGW